MIQNLKNNWILVSFALSGFVLGCYYIYNGIIDVEDPARNMRCNEIKDVLSNITLLKPIPGIDDTTTATMPSEYKGKNYIYWMEASNAKCKNNQN
jgi:hypothetical protein